MSPVEEAIALPLGLSDEALARAAKELHHLLRSIPDCLTHPGPELHHALRRYETLFLPLVAKSDATQILVPPPDVAWVWLTHMLAPEHYEADMQASFGKLVQRPKSALQRGMLGESTALARTKRGLPYTDGEYAATELVWRKQYPEEPFFVPWVEAPSALRKRAAAPPDFNALPSAFGYDIGAACERQRVFNYQVSLPQYGEDAFLKRAVRRYKMLLLLKRKFPDRFLVPCYDNDLVWHAHQLQPTYAADTIALHGKMMNHDDSVNDRVAGSKLSRSSDATQKLWSYVFGECFCVSNGRRTRTDWKLRRASRLRVASSFPPAPPLRIARRPMVPCTAAYRR